MQKLLRMASLLIFMLTICACARNGVDVKPVACPATPHPPSPLLQPINAEQRLRDELFESGQSVTPATVLGDSTPAP
jgi:hypothetical protein